MVVRLIRTVLAIRKNGRSKGPAHVSKVDPLMGRHFKLLRLGGWALDCANIPVVCRHTIGGTQRKHSLQVRFFCVPIDDVSELDAPAGISRRQAYDLDKPRSRALTCDFEGYPY